MEEIAAKHCKDIEQGTAGGDWETAGNDQETAQEFDSDIVVKDRQVLAKESRLSEKDRGLSLLQQRCCSPQTQLDRVRRSVQCLEVNWCCSKEVVENSHAPYRHPYE